MKLILQRVGLAVACALPLGGCLDAVVFPLNPEPTAYQDSLCVRGPQDNGEVVNYGCVAGRALVASKHHRRHRRIVQARS
jgi:hypothetical protein